MPKLVSDKAYLPFTKGLITEVSPLAYPEGATLDEDNIIITRAGERERRLGLKLDTDSIWVKPVASYRTCVEKTGNCNGASAGPCDNDPYYSNVVLLLHMDDPIIDIKGHSIALSSGIASQTTTYKCSPGASNNSGWISVDPHVDFDLGSSDFCLEGWFYFIDLIGGNNDLFGKWKDETGTNIFKWLVRVDNTDIELWWDTAKVIDVSHTMSINTWNHVAVTRSGTLGSIYINGILRQTGTLNNFTDGNDYIAIGAEGAFGDSRFRGYMDEIRITKGVPRYIGNFTPETCYCA